MYNMDYRFRLVGTTEFKGVREFTHPTYGNVFTGVSFAGGKKFSVTKSTALEAAKALDLYRIKNGFKQLNNTYKSAS